KVSGLGALTERLGIGASCMPSEGQQRLAHLGMLSRESSDTRAAEEATAAAEDSEAAPVRRVQKAPSVAPTDERPEGRRTQPGSPREAADAEAAVSARPARLRGRRLLLIAGFLVLAAAAAVFGQYWWTVGRFTVTTDDAYVRAYNTTL